MIKKFIKLVLFAAAIWCLGGVAYFLMAEAAIREKIIPAIGPDYSVELQPFDDLFLQNSERRAMVKVSRKFGTAGEASVSVNTEGRFYPKVSTLGNLFPLRRVIGDKVALIGKESRAQRARNGFDETNIDN